MSKLPQEPGIKICAALKYLGSLAIHLDEMYANRNSFYVIEEQGKNTYDYRKTRVTKSARFYNEGKVVAQMQFCHPENNLKHKPFFLLLIVFYRKRRKKVI